MTKHITSRPRVFISHSWKNKALARRIARRLAHRGVAVWIDESEMQVGDRLSDRLADEIRSSSHLAVVLTSEANASKWVAQEIEVARGVSNPAVALIPLIAERGITASVLDESLGVEITDPLTFEDRIETVAGAILGARPSGQRDATLLRRDLEAITREAPELRALIRQLADEGRITHSQLGATLVAEHHRHAAETALIALHELGTKDACYVISLVAAQLYRQMGVGFPVLRRQLDSQPNDGFEVQTMFSHLGDRYQRPEDLDGAFRLFQSATTPPDQAFAGFVRANFERFTQAQRDMAVTFVVTPDRGPEGFGIDAAFELYSRMPDNTPLRDLWWFWVNDYKFGGKEGVEHAQRPSTFFALMNEAAAKGYKQFDPVMEHFESSFRGLVRSRTLGGVLHSVGVLMAASNARYVQRAGLARQLMNALHSAEWDSVVERDEFYAPLRELAEAVARDESLSGALQLLHERLRASRPDASSTTANRPA